MSAGDAIEILFDFPSGSTSLLILAVPNDTLGTQIAAIPGIDRCCIITDENVARLHTAAIMQSLDRAGLNPSEFILPAGDANKTLASAAAALEWLQSVAADRHTAIVAVGGGMICDLAGFAAAIWMRGVPWIACPTTTLAMFDASLGGKTGVNLSGKNMIGAFHHPRLIWADVATLETLPAREFAAGLAESVKHAVALESALIDWHELHIPAILARDHAALARLVERNLRIKAAIVAADERECAPDDEVGRAALNFGHTVGHALESASGYAWLHGECVALGMIAAMELATHARKMQIAQRERVKSLLRRLGLPLTMPHHIEPDLILAAVRRDKKSRHGHPRMVIPDRLGRVIWHDEADDSALRHAIESIQPATG